MDESYTVSVPDGVSWGFRLKVIAKTLPLQLAVSVPDGVSWGFRQMAWFLIILGLVLFPSPMGFLGGSDQGLAADAGATTFGFRPRWGFLGVPTIVSGSGEILTIGFRPRWGFLGVPTGRHRSTGDL